MEVKSYKDKDWLYNKYVIENNTQKEIANSCELSSDSTIGNYIKKFNIKKEVIKHKDNEIINKIFDSNNYGKFKVLSFHSNYENSNVRKYLIEFIDTMSQNLSSKKDILDGSVADLSEKNKERFCEVCGVSSKEMIVSHWNKFNKNLCMKHYDQLNRYGKIFNRTMFDGNEIVKYEDYAEIIIYKQQEKGQESIEKDRLIIDLEDVEKCKKYKWQTDGKGYGKTTLLDKKHLSIHRYLLDYCGELEVDHDDRNPRNNRRNNLRISENYDNATNKGLRLKNTSGIIGVCWDKNRNKWLVRISYRNKIINLGRYEDREEAIKIRLLAELKYFKKGFAPQRHLFKEYSIGDNYE